MESTTIDDSPVLASLQSLIDNLYHQLLTEYILKRLGSQRRFLNWKTTQTGAGSHISQRDTINAIFQEHGIVVQRLFCGRGEDPLYMRLIPFELEAAQYMSFP